MSFSAKNTPLTTGPTVRSDPSLRERDVNAPAAYQRDLYGSFRKPPFSTNPAEWPKLARQRVPERNFNYVFGSAGTRRTYAANVEAFNRYRLKPRMLVDATVRDTSIELFGKRYPTPLLAAPIGVQSIMHKDGELATARACRSLNVPMILSTAATRTIEEVAQANGPDGHRWFQLYWPRPQDEAVTISLLRRARSNGFTALVVTLDTFQLGWRPFDLDANYNPFIWGQGCQIGFSDPVFNAQYNAALSSDTRPLSEKVRELSTILLRPGTPLGALRLLLSLPTLRKSSSWLDVMHSGTYRTWSDLHILRENWDPTGKLPIVLKGIQTVADARKIIEDNLYPSIVSGIIVSNHGGRQLDGAVASLDALHAITSDPLIASSGMPILFDSGVRSGSDVIKALAIGAKAVLVGRPYVYGLAISGEEGVRHVLQCLSADADLALANLGKRSLAELGRDDLEIVPRAQESRGESQSEEPGLKAKL